MNIWLSRNLAVALGIVTPLLETIRRWSTWQSDPLSYFDDFILGGLLLFGAWKVTKDAGRGQKYLVAGWGFALGMVYASLDSQLQQVRSGTVDPAPISTEWVAAIKGIGLFLVLIGLVTSLMPISKD